ncbi:MAG: UDP-N-acetylmuramoyl-tripeptide--D-alanyl-D-alanine ligase [Oscillospiraceae bacterium]|nr:UDP-N-acetylmuramoyl-tripeptide--D-alanyl-D-alanine ligase [Oscillospiraceae bacterium]
MGGISLKQATQWCGGTVAPQFESLTFKGVQFDSRALQAGELFVALVGERDGHSFVPMAMEKGAVAVLASRELDPNIPAVYVSDTLTAMQQIAKGYRESLSSKVIGITGSVGKTTTKEMVAAVLEQGFVTQKTPKNFNNNIGLPVTLMGLEEQCQMAVIEMGMNHKGEISLLTSLAQPDIALITNVGTMHIEYLGSRQGILEAKLEILEGLRPGGKVLFCGDNDLLQGVAASHNALCYGFGEHNDIRALNLRREEEWSYFTFCGLGQEFLVELPVQGDHNVLNALAAGAVGLLNGMTPEQIQKGLRGFANTDMRQNTYSRDGYYIIEDCYNAGPESTRAALSVLATRPGRKVAVLGGMLELGDYGAQAHYEIGQEAAKCARLLFAYGKHCEEMVAGAQSMDYARCFETHEDLVQALRKELREGDSILVKGSRGMRMERVLQLLFPQ